jgi:hypothetical protein
LRALYPIGTPGKKWGHNEQQQWLAKQSKKRDYNDLVVSLIDTLSPNFIVEQYGQLPDHSHLVTYALRSKNWCDSKPCVLITGGVHGYETSGVMGALAFAKHSAERFSDRVNFVILPCISPWGFETINRWNSNAVDPNRSFCDDSPAPEAALVINYLAKLNCPFVMHIDLHETTDTDNSEFRPALAAKQGTENTNWNIPDGFYLVGDTQRPVADFQQAIISAVEKVTHIAPADEKGALIGVPIEQFGVCNYDCKALFLCAGVTDADYVTTTEVYPDSPYVDAQNCIDAQVAAICGGLDYLISQSVISR